jgi:hypothetical protein
MDTSPVAEPPLDAPQPNAGCPMSRSRKGLGAHWGEQARAAFQESRLTLADLGDRMGYTKDAAHRAAWFFLYRTADPPLLEFCLFARAVGVPVATLVA